MSSNSGRAACPCTNELYQINKALTKFNEALTKPYHGLMKFYYKLISDIIVNDCTTKKILKSQYIFKDFFSFILY